MEATQETKKWTGKKIAKLVTDIVCWVFFAFALVFTVFAFTAQSSNTGFPTIGKKALLTVQTDSMESKDGFYVGDLITIKVLPDVENEKKADDRAKALSELKATEYNTDGTVKELGDVITFWRDIDNDGDLDLNSHRIVKIETSGSHTYFYTQGDNEKQADYPAVLDDEVVGVWTGKCAKGMGSFISFLQPPHVGFFVFIILPLAGFLGYEVVILVLTIKKMKDGDKKTISKAEEELIKQKAVEEYLKKQEAEKEASKETSDK